MPRPRVILESPFAGDIETNRLYALACMRDMLERGEAPFASHLLYPLVLSYERKLGIEAGLAWTKVADLSVIYTDLGITQGMRRGIDEARLSGVHREQRSLVETGKWSKP